MSAAEVLDLFWDRCEGSISFGVNDCCMVVADVVRAAGGPDLMAAYRGRYRTARGFVRAFRREGHETLHEACEASFAGNGKRVQKPQDFDVAMVGYRDRVKGMVASPGFFHGGFWCVRSEHGGLVLNQSIFEGTPQIYRVI